MRILKYFLSCVVRFILYTLFICTIFWCASTLHAKNNITDNVKCYFNDYPAGLSSKMENPKAQANGIDEALYNYVDSASSSLDCMIYEFNNVTLANKLADKHKNGVNVRIIFDSKHFKDDHANTSYDIIIKSGIKHVPNSKQHNKMIIADNNKILTGSMNFTKRGMYQNANQIIIVNNTSIAKAYTSEFNQMFEHKSWHKKKADNNDEEFIVGGSKVFVYFNPQDNLDAKLSKYIDNAKTSIRISMFSLTHKTIYKKLIDAKKRGVSVLGVYDYRSAGIRGTSQADELIANGCGYIDANPALMHNKWAIFDNKIVWLGSANWSKSGLTEGNDENVIVIHNADIAGKFLQEWKRYYNDANDYQANYKKRWARTEIHHYDWKWIKGAVVKFLGWKGCKYNIYRSKTKDGKYIKIGSVTPSESPPNVPTRARFIDTKAVKEMYYKVLTCGTSEYGNVYHPEPGEIGTK